MRVNPKLSVLALVVAALAGCAEGPPAPTAASESSGASFSESGTSNVELKRPKIDVTGWTDETSEFPAHLLDPNVARNIGPGSAILITIPGEGRFGCTANFIWQQGTKLYLGSAGHCFVPADKKATHGAGADYDASGVVVQVCVDNCGGNFRSNLLTGTWVRLGKVAYARQTNADGTEDVGNDFGVVEIPAEARHLVRAAMPVWGGPAGVDQLAQGEFACHYGNGLVVGETFLTKARVGVGGGSDKDWWMGDFAGAFGDSGSGIVACDQAGTGFNGRGAVGVLTHLGVEACPCDVNFKNLTVKANHGVIFGTTIARAKQMAAEAGLKLALVEP